MLPHLPCSCRLWEKALSLKCFQAVLFKEWQNREEIHTAMERPCAFPKTPNKQAKELQREKFTLWYSSYSTAPEILGHTSVVVMSTELDTQAVAPAEEGSPSSQGMFREPRVSTDFISKEKNRAARAGWDKIQPGAWQLLPCNPETSMLLLS